MGKWEMKSLGDVFLSICNGVSIKQGEKIGSGLPITRIETISDNSFNRMRMGYAGIKNAKAYTNYILKSGDILMSHINSTKHLGKTAIYEKQDDEIIIHGMNLLRLQVNPRELQSKYANYYFNSPNFKTQLPNITKDSVNQSSFTVTALKKLLIPIPPLPIQQKIADALDKASALIEMRKAQIEKLDLLIKSQFVEMFGDPGTNPKGWETVALAETGTFRNGINFGSNESGVSLYCLGVGDFGDKLTIDNTERLSRVILDKKPSEEHLLKDGDIVFVRSNGNKELVGRCVAVYPGENETTFSGFCIRYRKTLDSLLVEYLIQVLKASSTRYKMIGRGANIQNLNQQLLSQLVIPLPPVLLQQEFASTTRKIFERKRQIEESLNASESFYNSLMQKCFSGEMFE